VKVLSLHHILLPVTDVERSATFYEGLGMERITPWNARMAWVQFGPNQLHLWPTDEAHPYNGWKQEPSPHFCVEGDDIHAFAAAIPELGGEILQEPRQRPNGWWYLFALDPDGNRFEITQRV
jgi:catechol 2,3-dioxygenase-like lactoylglutathione lyase family enzyme